MYVLRHNITRSSDVFISILLTLNNAHAKSNQTFKIEHSTKIVQPCCFLEVWMGSEYASVEEI